MLLRFVRSTTVEGTKAREGFFAAAYELKEKSDTDPLVLERLDRLLGWFRQNLVVPARFNRSKSKGFYRRKNTRGLSWFKPDAQTHLSKAFELAELLLECGYDVEVLKSARPGYVIYEDDV